jgi:hypothetical protein
MQLTLVASPTSRLREATDTVKGVVMRAIRFEFNPEQVRITAEEILADLRYPARQERVRDVPKRPRRRRPRV